MHYIFYFLLGKQITFKTKFVSSPNYFAGHLNMITIFAYFLAMLQFFKEYDKP